MTKIKKEKTERKAAKAGKKKQVAAKKAAKALLGSGDPINVAPVVVVVVEWKPRGKFGEDCKTKATCRFWHPGVPSGVTTPGKGGGKGGNKGRRDSRGN